MEDRIIKIRENYGLLNFEVDLFLQLNDLWYFSFEEFGRILRFAPKSYGETLTATRLQDSIKWLRYIETFRAPRTTFDNRGTWYFFIYEKIVLVKNLQLEEDLLVGLMKYNQRK